MDLSIHGLSDEAGDMDKIMSLELIREYTKTDDDPTISDNVLKLLRASSIEAAELYTGQKWSGISVYEQDIQTPISSQRRYIDVNLKYPSVDGIVVIVGGDIDGTMPLNISPGSRKLRLPVINNNLGFACCYPCGSQSNMGMRAIYRIGWNCRNPLPAGIVKGCLQYIAWSIRNPGDKLVTMNDGTSNSASGISGTNNVAIASGAVEQWRMYNTRSSVA